MSSSWWRTAALIGLLLIYRKREPLPGTEDRAKFNLVAFLIRHCADPG